MKGSEAGRTRLIWEQQGQCGWGGMCGGDHTPASPGFLHPASASSRTKRHRVETVVIDKRL